MLKRLLLAIIGATLVVGITYAQQSTSKVVIPVKRTSPTDGKQMYNGYCAPCHGLDGKGNGPAATALKTPPTDLTAFSKNNHGKYPDAHIVSVLRFGAELTAHGSADMPVWGPILGRMNQVNSQDKQLRISNLSRYIESMQVQ